MKNLDARSSLLLILACLLLLTAFGCRKESGPAGEPAAGEAATGEPAAGEPVEPPPAGHADAETATADAVALPSPASRRQQVMNVIRRQLSGFSEPRLHLAPNIPRYKLDNVAALHRLDPSAVLLLYDDGLKEGGKTGFCLTDERVYWRFISGSPPRSVNLEDIRDVQVKKKKFFIDGEEVSVIMASNPQGAAETFGKLLEALRDELR